MVYNYGLSLYSQLDHKEYKGGSSKKIAAIKKVLTNYTKKQAEFAWMKELSSTVYQSALVPKRDAALQALQTAFSRFFKGLGKYPKFKRKKDSNSFTVYDCNGVVLLESGKKIKIPTLGRFRLKKPLDARYVTQTFTISTKGSRWFVSFSVDAQRLPPLYKAGGAGTTSGTQACRHEKTQVGIDLGVKCFATLSDGTTYVCVACAQRIAPKPMKKAKTKLAKLQWRNRNKHLGNVRKGIRKSKNAAKYYIRLGNRHAQIANQRRDFLQKTTTEISRKYSVIRIEDLNIQGMIANHKLSAAISDLGFYEFRRQLVYKQDNYATRVELVDRWYPSSKTCSCCNHVQPMPLSERVFKCQACGVSIDRDLNAAINCLQAPEEKIGRATTESDACGEEGADSPVPKRDRYAP
jgi:putative transposase